MWNDPLWMESTWLSVDPKQSQTHRAPQQSNKRPAARKEIRHERVERWQRRGTLRWPGRRMTRISLYTNCWCAPTTTRLVTFDLINMRNVVVPLLHRCVTLRHYFGDRISVIYAVFGERFREYLAGLKSATLTDFYYNHNLCLKIEISLFFISFILFGQRQIIYRNLKLLGLYFYIKNLELICDNCILFGIVWIWIK